MSRVRSRVHTNGEIIDIPPDFWLSVDWDRDIDGSDLKRGACKRLWKLLRRSGPCPKRMTVEVNAEELMRAFPPRVLQ